MTKYTILEAIVEAERYIRAAKAVLDDPELSMSFITGTAKTGALRRSSMDLTRALARMRRP